IIYMKHMGRHDPLAVGHEAECDYIVVSSAKEQITVSNLMGFPKERLLLTGIPIFDKLHYKHINNNSDDILTIMLTWKPYEEYLDNFKESSYYKNTMFLLRAARKHLQDHQIQVIAHPKFSDFMRSTD